MTRSLSGSIECSSCGLVVHHSFADAQDRCVSCQEGGE